VQSDILNRVQESRARLETEIRKLLHEVSRIAEQALACAKRVREEGVPAVEAGLQRLDSFGRGSVRSRCARNLGKLSPESPTKGILADKLGTDKIVR
jgi:HEAT repeat protein